MMKQLHFLIAPLILLCTTIHITATDHSTFHEKEPAREFSLVRIAIVQAWVGALAGSMATTNAMRSFQKRESTNTVILNLFLPCIPGLAIAGLFQSTLADFSTRATVTSSIAYTIGALTSCICKLLSTQIKEKICWNS